MAKIFLDTETCGFEGPMVLLQYAEENDPVTLHSVWTEPIKETLQLLEYICENTVIGFNLSFDWFKICQTYTTMSLFRDKNAIPIDHIEQYALFEAEARNGLCLKPYSCFDIMLHARKGPYQSTMNRDDIRIKKVPAILSHELAEELNQRIKLNDIYFERRQDKTIRWQVFDIKNDLGDVSQDFKDIVLKFSPSSALKALAVDTGVANKNTRLFFSDIALPDKAKPVEIGYAPFALAIGKPGNWKGTWPDVIHMHIAHWAYNSMAREYARDDVLDTRGLYEFFGSPEPDDDDSILACMVGAVRWKGFRIDIEKIKGMKGEAENYLKNIKFNYNAPEVCRKYLEQVMDQTEKLIIRDTTKATILEEITKWTVDKVCDDCGGMGCNKCTDGLLKTNEQHEAAKRAKEILDARHAKKEIETYEKLLIAGRFHASFNVIGTLSSRMSGSGGLNAQGIKKAKEVRKCFPLADTGNILVGGDFSGFEVVLMDAAYGDPELRKDLQSGKKIHALFGVFLFPPKTYEEILETDITAKNPEDNLYTRSKQCVFALAYGGEAYTLSTRGGVDQKIAEEAYQRWIKRYVVWGEARKRFFNMFCSMSQSGGIGSKVEWKEPADYIESMFGFKRYFTLENQICKVLYQLAEKPPKAWLDLKIRTVRRDREQYVGGAIRSALFAAAFALQAANMRAAGNHVIQSSGAQITKGTQRRIWDVQPAGINHWRVQPMNVHDEIMSPTHPQFVSEVEKKVKEYLEELRPRVPLIKMDWANRLDSWADKG